MDSLSDRGKQLEQLLRDSKICRGMQPLEPFEVETQNGAQQVPRDAMVVVVHDKRQDTSVLKISIIRPVFEEVKIPVAAIVSIKTQWAKHTL